MTYIIGQPYTRSLKTIDLVAKYHDGTVRILTPERSVAAIRFLDETENKLELSLASVAVSGFYGILQKDPNNLDTFIGNVRNIKSVKNKTAYDQLLRGIFQIDEFLTCAQTPYSLKFMDNIPQEIAQKLRVQKLLQSEARPAPSILSVSIDDHIGSSAGIPGVPTGKQSRALR